MKFENNLLRDLYESTNGLFVFTFYTRYSIEPEEMVYFIEKYTKKGIIEYENDRLCLTNEGRNIILKQLFFNKKGKGKFSNIPQEFIQDKIEINSLYLPNLSNVSAEILNQKKVE